ncbi:PH domain-containing protein [Streptomyces orinoci]|uniref:PH domain-containing protein n=1 Tax=Streptomyces orinoci TaxID=67339 RepID=A0ABV3JQS5_STRON|nr:PH domain-containing protein [Streptomyces orinoci]
MSEVNGDGMSEARAGETSEANSQWRKLDPRTLLAHCAWLGPPLGSLALTALATGGHLTTRAWITLGIIALVFTVITAAGFVIWRRTRFRVTTEALELRTGLLSRRFRSIPLHRIRNIDLTASPVQRVLGLVVLRIGTGGHQKRIALETLSRAEAERLRTELLARGGTPAADAVLATADPRWLRYAPLTFWVFGGVLTAGGGLWRALDGMGIKPWEIGPVRNSFAELGHRALWLTIPLALIAVLALGTLGAIALYIKDWWRYRLEWSDPATLRVSRGLLTTHSVSIERARLRGVAIDEPLLLRAGGGATVHAVAGGLGNQEENEKRSILMPPAPRAEALRIRAGVLGEEIDTDQLRPHPRVALRRRITRVLAWAVLPVTVVLTLLGALLTPVLLWCALGWLLLSVPLALTLARSAYRALGHELRGRWLVIRSGTLWRRTVALDRTAVVAWTFTDSPFSRRAGVCTTTAAVAVARCADGHHIRDMAAQDAAGFAESVTPGLLREFLV